MMAAAQNLPLILGIEFDVQVGSHYHFIETNPYLRFDRRKAYGKRLNILAGTAVRFEPGESKNVVLVDIGGKKVVYGGNALCDGPVQESKREEVMKRVLERGQCSHSSENGCKERGSLTWLSMGCINIRCSGFAHEDENTAQGSSTKRQRTSSSSSGGHHDSIPDLEVHRENYANTYGPTVGDLVRLGDTNLFVRGEEMVNK